MVKVLEIFVLLHDDRIVRRKIYFISWLSSLFYGVRGAFLGGLSFYSIRSRPVKALEKNKIIQIHQSEMSDKRLSDISDDLHFKSLSTILLVKWDSLKVTSRIFINS